MTNHWNDLANSDCILIMGSNPAENHPISFKWVLKAQDKGAKVVSVDPRFTHSSSKADFYVQLRVGTDIAFLGGMINYILNNDKYFKQYVIDSTNGPTVVGEQFGFSDGLFSGFNADKKSYDKKTWAFEMDANGVPVRDETLTHPRCVLQLLKKHYDRYTLDKVSETTGTPKEDLLRVYETFASTGAPDKAGTIMYAMGWTQKSVGVQNIRAMSIIQLLLGNIGVAGGGVNALRGESNVQGSTDQALLADIWPGYLPVPTSTLTTLADYNATTPKTNDPKSVNWWGNRPKYTASFLMSLYPGVTPDVAYSYVPRLDADKKRTDYMWMSIFDRMVEGKLAARWGTTADIAPYIDPVPDWNIPLTRTEGLTMTSRPKQPKYARNKNILVIGGSGSGKTRFFVKPSIMQMHSSYVITDPKGYNNIGQRKSHTVRRKSSAMWLFLYPI